MCLWIVERYPLARLYEPGFFRKRRFCARKPKFLWQMVLSNL